VKAGKLLKELAKDLLSDSNKSSLILTNESRLKMLKATTVCGGSLVWCC